MSLATELTDALKAAGAQCTAMVWPQRRRPTGSAELLRDQLGTGGFDGVVVLTGPKNGDPDEECAVPWRGLRHHLVRIARELPEIPGESPRLYVVTRNAQTVLPDDVANLEQAGLRGLMRVIGNEHPHLRATQIDLDEDTRRRAAGTATAGRSRRKTRPPGGTASGTRRACAPSPLRPDERRTTVVDHEQRRYGHADPHAR